MSRQIAEDLHNSVLASTTPVWTSASASLVGLGNVDNTSDATKNSATATLTNKTISLGNNTLVATLAQMNAALSDFDLVAATSAVGSAMVPNGTTAQRDASPGPGYLRFNTTLSQFEGYNGTSWGAIGGGSGGATGGGSDDVFYENSATVTTDYTITTGKNAMTAGPIEINNGVTITVPSGSVWTIV